MQCGESLQRHPARNGGALKAQEKDSVVRELSFLERLGMRVDQRTERDFGRTECTIVAHQLPEDKREEGSLQSTLSEVDLYLIGEGTHNRAYDRLGAHLAERDGHPLVFKPDPPDASAD